MRNRDNDEDRRRRASALAQVRERGTAEDLDWLSRHAGDLRDLPEDTRGSLAGERSDGLLDADGDPLGSLSDAASARSWPRGSEDPEMLDSSSVAAAGPRGGHGHAPKRDLEMFRRLLAEWGTLHVPRHLPRGLLLIVLVDMTRGPHRLRPASAVAAFLNRERQPIPPQPEIGFDGEPNPGPIARVSVRQVQRLIRVLRALIEDPPLDPETQWRHFVEAMELKGVTVEGPFRYPGTADPNAPATPPLLIATAADGTETRWHSVMGSDGRWKPTTSADPCPRCGAPVPRPSPFTPKRGPKPVYCSTRCSDAARQSRRRSVVSR